MAKKNNEDKVRTCLGLDSLKIHSGHSGGLLRTFVSDSDRWETVTLLNSPALSSVKTGKLDFFVSAESVDDFEGGLSLAFDLCQKQFLGIHATLRMMAGTSTSILGSLGDICMAS